MIEHVIADELLAIAHREISHGNIHIAYNECLYFLDKKDVYFFKTHDEAHEFSLNNISEYDHFNIIQAHSYDEFLQQVLYGESLRIQLLTTKNNLPMNEKNYDYLARQLKYTGFGEELLPALKKKLESGDTEFTLAHQKNYDKDETVATLQFKKGQESDIVYFNRYSFVLKNEQHPEAIKQTFFIANNESTISLKEAYNLMSGRAVYKEGLENKEKQEYKAWLQLDFKVTDKHGNFKLQPYNENYGFNLEKSLNVHSIKEMNDTTTKERLIESLQRGNRQSVTMTVQGSEQKLWIEAAPRFKSLNIYNESGTRLKPQDLYIKQSASLKQSEEVKQSMVQEPGAELKQDASKRNVLKQRNSDDLDSGGKKKRVKQQLR